MRAQAILMVAGMILGAVFGTCRGGEPLLPLDADSGLAIIAPLSNALPTTEKDVAAFDEQHLCPACHGYWDRMRDCPVCSGTHQMNPMLSFGASSLKEFERTGQLASPRVRCPLCKLKRNPDCPVCRGTGLKMAYGISFLPLFENRNANAVALLSQGREDAMGYVHVGLPSLKTVALCPACKGGGKMMLTEPNKGQYHKRLGQLMTRRVTCPVCDGTGHFKTYVDPDQLALQASRDWLQYDSTHRARGEIAVGNAFITAEDYDTMDRKRLKLISSAFPDACKTCNWTGVVPCKTCQGDGLIVCTAKDCEGGWIVEEQSVQRVTGKTSCASASGCTPCKQKKSGSIKTKASSSNRRTTSSDKEVSVSCCTTCGGAQIIACTTCRGQRATICKKCHGSGVNQKAGRP